MKGKTKTYSYSRFLVDSFAPALFILLQIRAIFELEDDVKVHLQFTLRVRCALQEWTVFIPSTHERKIYVSPIQAQKASRMQHWRTCKCIFK